MAAQTVVTPVIGPGVMGAPGLTVIDRLRGELLPQLLSAVTESVPPVAPAAKSIVMLVPPPLIVAPVPESRSMCILLRHQPQEWSMAHPGYYHRQ